MEAFSDLYSDVSEDISEQPYENKMQPSVNAGLQGIFDSFKLSDIGAVPLVLLFLLMADVDDKERLIILALAIAFGI